MKTKRALLVLVASGLALVLAFFATREAKQSRAALRAAHSMRDALREQISALDERLHTAELAPLSTVVSGRPNVAGGGATDTPTPRDPRASGPPVSSKPFSSRTRIVNDPEQLARYTKNFRESLDLEFGGMVRTLGLSVEQFERFKTIETELEVDRMDLQASIEMQGLDPNSPAVKQLRADNDARRVAKKTELFGDLMPRYLEYYSAYEAREVAEHLSSTFAPEVATAAQVDRVTQILAAASTRGSNGWVMINTIDWDKARAQLPGVLSPTQIEDLGRFARIEQNAGKYADLTRRLTAEFKTRAAGH